MQTKYTMRFDANQDRWYTTSEDNHQSPIHCGETFIILLAHNKIQCRIEMDSDWYIIFGNKRFKLHPKETYEIQLH